ncbi:MAG: CPBP family intramembrane metalloprotease [Bacteroidetes bacterium]|nr:CPBP family intramembrane metalloprotease [Bacteroidota bacterium]
MLQIIALLFLSWLFIMLYNRQHLSVLGLKPTAVRMKYFFVLMIVSALFAATNFWLKEFFTGEKYILQQPVYVRTILGETWNQLRTVLTEELICRGALLYILIKVAGQSKAILLSSIVFAVLHWLNAGVWGNTMQMILVFSFTFAMGLLLAFAYARTGSLLIPLAIHFGWNITQNYIYPGTETGNHLFVLAAAAPTVTISYGAFFTMLLFPEIAVILVDYSIVKTHRQVTLP